MAQKVDAPITASQKAKAKEIFGSQGTNTENLMVLGALLFASQGRCSCKACRLLKQMANTSVDLLVDSLLQKAEGDET